MKVIIKTVLEQDELIQRIMSAYVDDVLSADEVRSRLESFGLSPKDLTQLRDGTMYEVFSPPRRERKEEWNVQRWFDPITVSDWNKIAVCLDQSFDNFG